MSDHFVVPSTPPRSSKPNSVSTIRSPPVFQTPTTPKKNKEFLLTPLNGIKRYSTGLNTPNSNSKRSNNAHHNSNNLLPITPNFTPKKSPIRLGRKRKLITDDIFKHTNEASSTISTTKECQFGLLLPAPSTIGSGRKLTNSTGKWLKAQGMKPETLSELKNNLNFEEDEFEDHEEKLILDSPILKEPITPSAQLINGDLVNHWHNKSYNNNYSSDEEEIMESELNLKKATLVNPFISNLTTPNQRKSIKGPESVNPFNSTSKEESSNVNSKVNLRTHVEYINHITGEKKLVKLSSRQIQMKPKKLDFSKFNEF